MKIRQAFRNRRILFLIGALVLPAAFALKGLKFKSSELATNHLFKLAREPVSVSHSWISKCSPLLMLVSEQNQILALNEAIERRNMESVRALIQLGIPVNGVYPIESPLSVAASIGDLEAAEFLISQGALLNPKIAKLPSPTPVWSAAYSDHPKMIEFLASQGADVNLGHPTVKSPLSIAKAQRSLASVKILEKFGAKEFVPVVHNHPGFKTQGAQQALKFKAQRASQSR